MRRNAGRVPGCALHTRFHSLTPRKKNPSLLQNMSVAKAQRPASANAETSTTSHLIPSLLQKIPLVAVGLTDSVESTVGEEVVVGRHEIRVASDSRLAVEVGNSIGDETVGGSLVGDTTGISGESKLGDPDLGERVGAGSVDSLLDESLELVDVVSIPVNSDTGELARRALGHERTQPAQTLAVGGGGRHGGGDELGLAGVRGDVVLVVAGSVGGRHVGLRRDIRLVETQDVLATAGQSSLNGSDPATEVPGTPEHRDVVDTGGHAAGQGHGPVIGPGNVSAAGHGRDGRDVIVSGTALASAALLVLDGGSQGGGGHQAGSEQLSEGNHFD